MIQVEQYPQALRALQRLIVHAKAQAYADGKSRVAALLNDLEMLPECLADQHDRTEDFLELLHGIAQVDPSCRYILEEFEQSSVGQG